MTVNADKFRADFPEFANVQTYAVGSIDFYLALAEELHDPARWATIRDFGIELFVAHNLSVEFESLRAARRGQNPGQVISPITGGSVDKVSYQRAASSILDPKNGHWNLSIYGLRYIRLVQMVGAGPVYVGPTCPSDAGSAWAGPGTQNFNWN